MKTFKLNLVLLVTFFAVVFSSCNEEEVIAPQPERETEIDEKLDLKDKSTTAKIVVKPAIPAKDYVAVFKEMAAKGYRLIFVDGYLHTEGNSTQTKTVNYFNAIFEENVDGIQWASFFGLTGESYQSKFTEWTGKGYRLIHIESYPQNGGIRYAPIFAKISGSDWIAYHGFKAADHQNKFEDLTADGFRLVNRSIVAVGDEKYVTALYDKKNVGAWVAKSGLDGNATQTMMENQYNDGKMLGFLDISQTSSSQFTYGPIFNSEEHSGWYAKNMLSLEQLEDEIADAGASGYKTNIVVGYDEPGLIQGNEVYHMRFAASWIK